MTDTDFIQKQETPTKNCVCIECGSPRIYNACATSNQFGCYECTSLQPADYQRRQLSAKLNRLMAKVAPTVIIPAPSNFMAHSAALGSTSIEVQHNPSVLNNSEDAQALLDVINGYKAERPNNSSLPFEHKLLTFAYGLLSANAVPNQFIPLIAIALREMEETNLTPFESAKYEKLPFLVSPIQD